MKRLDDIAEGLRDAVQIANCYHADALPFTSATGRTYWHCPRCGGRFWPKPEAAEAREEKG